MRSFRFTFAFVFILLALVAAGCASGPEKVEYTIEMTDFAFTPNTLELKVGQEVTLHLKNVGALKHNFDFNHEWKAGCGYVTDWGRGNMNMLRDRDVLTMSVSRTF